ncbi:MAG TPA: hypothetical protein VK964_10870 [Nocardioidaceae bacterium]|nr:hypothetical protein [Nocardioidaceae bacterium]
MPLFFFVISFDLDAIVDDPVVLAAVPAFLMVRGGRCGPHDRMRCVRAGLRRP